MTYIKRVTMSGFKSFGNRTVSVNLAKGFTCIIGPNGNGKSNVIDALCFALGRMSKKTMRAKSLTDLIFAGSKTKKPATKAEVTITFDNSNQEFPDAAKEYDISRWIKAKGTSGYKIQGKKATREAILNALAQANIDPDGSNQFVLQGKIVELTHMNTNARREFIETLIGLEKYDNMKENTLKELEKADKDLGQFEAIFKEVSAQLKKVEKEKNDALRWKELDNAIKLYNAQLIALKIHKLREEEEQLNADIEETSLIIEEMETKVTRQKEKIEAEALLLKNIEEDLATQEDQRAKIEEELTQQKSDLSAKQATCQASKESLDRLQSQITKLEALQDKLDPGQTYQDLITLTTQEIAGVVSQIDETGQLIDETVSEQKERESQITDLNKQISAVQQTEKALTTEINLLEKSIKKNTKKLDKLQKELALLKKEGESVEEAMQATQAESDTITQKIQDLKTAIDDQKQRQKDIDKEIKKLEKSRDSASRKYSDIQAAISSTSAEINLLNKNITDLEDKKAAMQKEYDRLTKGKKVEEQINALKETEKSLLSELKESKDKLQAANEEQKKSQNKKDSLELKRRTFEAEMSDIEKRLSALKVELKTLQGEIKVASRDQTQTTSQKEGLITEIKSLTDQQVKLQKAAENLTNKIIQLTEERKLLQENITRKETEQEETSGELESVMATLQNLMENIDRSAGDIKSDIQNASQVAIDESSRVFRNFVMDITDMLGSVEEVAKLEVADEIKEQLIYAVDTLKLLVENAEEPIAQLNELVQDASEEALQESTSNFDGFIQDFTDKFDSIRVALQATSVSDTSELYKQLDSLNESLQNENANLSTTNNQLTKISTQIEQKNKELKQFERLLGELEKKLNDNQGKIEKATIENDEKSALIDQNKTEITALTAELEGLKKFSDDFWKITKDLQAQIDTKGDELTQVQSDLNDLGNVKRILEDIESATRDQEKLTKEIETKKGSISELSTSSEKAKNEVDSILESINQVKAERDVADETRTDLQNQIDEENENLKGVAARIKDLQNVQNLIAEISTLNIENDESANKIEVNTQEITSLTTQITQLETDIKTLQSERSELESKEQELRANLKELNLSKNASEKKLDRQNQMQSRANEIEGLKIEIADTEDNITELEASIQEITENLESLESKRTEKLTQINDLQSQKSDSWEKQKSLRDELGDFNSELSRQSAKMNNLEARKVVIEERIDELFENSKDYGTLPPVTDDLAEPTLNQSIAKATNEKKALEPVNLKSIEEYDVVKERWDEIDMRRQTLQRERKAILDSIDRIELEKTRNFMKAYHEINRVFSAIFQKLSPGGSAKMILENPAHPFEGGISIEARPRGKKISSLEILSGGEKTLVALSFIFSIQNFYPAPFYIMDEIDAALDGPNVYRVSMVIKEYADQSQFLVISHREENISNSDRIYGVAMNDGITDIFTVNLEEEAQREDYETQDEVILDEPIVTDNLDENEDGD